MDLLNGNIRGIYFRYLAAAFGSTLLAFICTVVDTVVMGQSQGLAGAAALAVIAPIWNLIFSLGLLTGISWAVLFSVQRGKGNGSGRGNEYFTVFLCCLPSVALAVWLGIIFFGQSVLRFCGADEARCRVLRLRPARSAPQRRAHHISAPIAGADLIRLAMPVTELLT
nr:hypothetical protein [Fretibacterium sp.]